MLEYIFLNEQKVNWKIAAGRISFGQRFLIPASECKNTNVESEMQWNSKELLLDGISRR